MRLSVARSLAVLMGLILTSSTLIILLIVWPSVKHILLLQGDIHSTQVNLEEQYLRTKHLRRSMKELGATIAQTKKFASATLLRGEELRLITELEAIAETHHVASTLDVEFSDPKTGESRGKGDIQDPHYRIAVLNQASFEDHLRYLDAIEALPYYLNIDRLEWNAARERDATGLVTLRFEGIVFVSGFSTSTP